MLINSDSEYLVHNNALMLLKNELLWVVIKFRLAKGNQNEMYTIYSGCILEMGLVLQ